MRARRFLSALFPSRDSYSSFASSVKLDGVVLLLLQRFPGKKVKKLAAKFYHLRHKNRERDQSHLFSRERPPTDN